MKAGLADGGEDYLLSVQIVNMILLCSMPCTTRARGLAKYRDTSATRKITPV